MALKNNQRLDNARLAEVLAERGMVEPKVLSEALQLSGPGQTPFTECLVNANLVADWELSRVVSELYGLPFVTVETYKPDPDAYATIDADFLRENALVPLGRFGEVLTVCMPAMVPAEVLGMLAAETDLNIIPVVGTVRSNRAWLDEHLAVTVEEVAETSAFPPLPTPGQAAPAAEGSQPEADWSSLFDEADAKVLGDLGDEEGAGFTFETGGNAETE